jgi:O-methyltransferase involved in polyketide biosynthesis
MATNFPPGVQGVKLRTRYFDDRHEQLGRGCRQVLIIGAGLDTRGVRQQAPGVTYFEIDDADILSFKQARLAEAGIKAQIVFIPGNYVTEGSPTKAISSSTRLSVSSDASMGKGRSSVSPRAHN